jgi:hypothetical protein
VANSTGGSPCFLGSRTKTKGFWFFPCGAFTLGEEESPHQPQGPHFTLPAWFLVTQPTLLWLPSRSA